MLMLRTHLGELPQEEISTDSFSELEEGFEDAFEKQ